MYRKCAICGKTIRPGGKGCRDDKRRRQALIIDYFCRESELGQTQSHAQMLLSPNDIELMFKKSASRRRRVEPVKTREPCMCNVGWHEKHDQCMINE